MVTVIKFTLKDKNNCYAYYCNQSDDQSGEYVSLPDYRHDLANVQQELIAAQEEIKRLREALTQIYQGFQNPVEIARKALNDD